MGRRWAQQLAGMQDVIFLVRARSYGCEYNILLQASSDLHSKPK